MTTRSLTIRGLTDPVLARLRDRAAARHRSLNGEVLAILARAAEEAPAASHGADVLEAVAPHAPVAIAAPAGAAATAAEAAANGAAAAAPPPAEAAGRLAPASLLDAIDRTALRAVCRQHHIRWLAVFGSHARGDARADSDVDVVVEFEPGRTPGLGIIRVADALRPVLGGRRVDLVTRRGLAPRLRDRVLSEARELHAA
jgi:uncharacterized protein